MLSAAYFTKEMDTWTIDKTTQYAQDFFNDGTLYDVDQKLNGSGAKTEGIEFSGSTFFSFLPEPFNNMGGLMRIILTWILKMLVYLTN